MQAIANTTHWNGRRLAVVALGLIVASISWTDAAVLQGIVKDANGRPLSGANLRIEPKTGGNSSKVVQTDGRGHYMYDGLTTGVTYRVSLLVAGAVKASINNVLAKTEPTTLDFNLKTTAPVASAAAKKHYVWVPATTGTNIGGRWVEVNDDTSDGAGANNLERLNREAMRRLQSGAGTQGKSSGGQ